jgi:hypothetical protein
LVDLFSVPANDVFANSFLVTVISLVRADFTHISRPTVSRASRRGRGQKLLPTVVAAKVERFPIAVGVESGRFVHGHSADGVLGCGF